MIDTHENNAYGHAWSADQRRQHAPPSAHRPLYDFRPAPRRAETPMWMVVLAALAVPTVFLALWVML